MKKIILSVLTVFLLLPFASAQRAAVFKETYLYSVKDSDSLYLDKYQGISASATQPCVIFMFGGGFVNGNRDKESYIPYFEFLVSEGYTVVSIDYRLGFKDFKPEGKASPKAFVKRLIYSIDIAVEDLFDATAFVLDNASKWGVDRNMIIANGSSAGAVSVLQAEMAICNQLPVVNKLPEGFNYAGVMAFAGAVFGRTRDYGFSVNPCPILMFHGDADSNVPYDKIRKFGFAFYGSKHIAGTLDEIGSPYCFYSLGNAAHEIAVDPMSVNRREITAFINDFIKAGKPLAVTVESRDLTKPELNKKIRLMDYVRSNFGE